MKIIDREKERGEGREWEKERERGKLGAKKTYLVDLVTQKVQSSFVKLKQCCEKLFKILIDIQTISVELCEKCTFRFAKCIESPG